MVCGFWEGEVREEGCKVVRVVEESVVGVFENGFIGVGVFLFFVELEEVCKLVVKVEEFFE